eukprot:14095820-Alexandrium_andersonii.AAC.1
MCIRDRLWHVSSADSASARKNFSEYTPLGLRASMLRPLRGCTAQSSDVSGDFAFSRIGLPDSQWNVQQPSE